MTTEAPEQGLKAQRRRRTLEPYIQWLQDIQADEKRTGPFGEVVTIQGIEVRLDAIAVDESGSPAGGPQVQSDSELILQSLALLMKSEVDATRLLSGVASTVTDLYMLQAELMLDCAVGTALLREIKSRIEDLVQKGSVQSARKLSKAQHRLGGLVRDLKRTIDESNRESAEELVSDLTEQTEHVEKPAVIPETKAGIHETQGEDPGTEGEDHETGAKIADGRKTARRKRKRPAHEEPIRPARGNLRTPVLLALVGIAFAVWMVSAMVPQLMSHALKELSRADFISSAPIVEIVARPPSLYVTLDAKTWSGYDDAEKRRLVHDMGDVLASQGYWGLLLRTPDGRSVARWLVNGGSRLLESERRPETAPRPQTQSFDRFVP